jgi:histidinol-phosphate aminotransferase
MANPWDTDRLPTAIAALQAYDPGHDLVAWRRRFPETLVELGSNENPLGPSPDAMAAAREALAQMHRYPDPLGGDLKRALARRHEVDASQIMLGNGSHELLMLVAQAFASSSGQVGQAGRNAGLPTTDALQRSSRLDPLDDTQSPSIVFSRYGFAVFAIATAASGARAVPVPALADDHPDMPFGHDLAALAAVCDEATRVLYLANPNNPTGTWFGREELEALLGTVPASTLVVVDEAYQECQPDADASSALRLLAAHPNLLVTRTFSKAYALAGLRVGYAVAAVRTIAVLERLRESFNVNGPALAAAEAALADDGHLANVLAFNERERARMADALRTLGLRVWPSRTNFLLVGFGGEDRASRIESSLCEQGIIVRPMRGYGLGHCLRISVGTIEDNDRLLAALEPLA